MAVKLERTKALNQIEDETYIFILVCFVIGFTPIQSLILMTLRSFIYIPGKIDTVFTYFVYGLIVLLSVKTLIRRNIAPAIALVLFFLIEYIFSICFYGSPFDGWLNEGISILLAVSCSCITLIITDISKFKTYLYKLAVIMGISSSILLFVYGFGNNESYSQYHGYIALTPAIISASALFERFKYIHFINFILSLITVIYAGARGPLICIALFFVIKILFNTNLSRKKLLIIIITSLIIALFISFFFEDLLKYLINLGEKHGFSLRLLMNLENRTLFVDTSRHTLMNSSWNVLASHPLLGVGIYNDRIILSNMMDLPSSEIKGWYPHNIFLEILLQFGLVLGGILIIGFLWLIYCALVKNKNRYEKNLVIIFLAIGFLPLLFSESYIESNVFFLFLGLCLNVARNERILVPKY
jgi:O-antigen ligase